MRTIRGLALTFLLLLPPGLAAAGEAPPDASASPVESPVGTPVVKTPEPELAAEIEALRAEVARLRDEVEERPTETAARGNGLRTADLASRAPGALRLGGVLTAAGVLAGDRTTQFAIPRGAIFAYAPVGDRLSFAGEVTFLGGGAESVDGGLGAPGRGDVFLQFAAADLVVVPDALTLRGGLVAVPMGRENLRPDESVRELLARPGEAIWIVPTPWFDAGGGALGGFDLHGLRLEYQAYVLSGVSNAIDARQGLRDARQAPGRDQNADKAVAGRLVARPWSWIEIGASGYSGAYDTKGARRLSMGELDAAADFGALVFEAEGVYAGTDGGPGATGLPVPRSMFGGSGQVTWRFLPDALRNAFPANLQASQIGVSARYSFADTDGRNADTAPAGNTPESYTRRDRLGLGLSFRPVDRCILRAEYEFRSEGGGSFVDDDRAILSATVAF